MALLEGKTPTERNKIIAAGVLGLIALIALYLAFGRSFIGGSTTVKVTGSPTPRPAVSTSSTKGDTALPSRDEQNFTYQTTVVDYRPGNDAPDPGRNIFEFYEPPPPTPYSPTPIPVVTPKPPTPTPVPPIVLASISPLSVYAGSPRGFRLEVAGDRFTPDAQIYFNQTQMPTVFVSAQRLTADIPANLIAQEGPRQVIVQTRDGKSYSEQRMLNVQAPPKPTFQYIGMISRARHNNDTAYFSDSAQPIPFGARLNDVVAGRFRVIDISPASVLVEDVDLGFKHRLPIAKTPSTTTTTSRGTFQNGNFVPYNPNGNPQGDIPGIPNNVTRPQQQKTPDKNKDVDDDGNGGF
jgi:hypothetical protein